MSLMGEMMDNITHQWRQQLSVISTASTNIKLKNELKILEEEEINKHMNYINNSAQYLSNTIDDFRDFYKNDKDDKKFKITDTFEKIFNLIDYQFKECDITLIKNIEEVLIIGFENDLVQLFINILNNAKYKLIEKKCDNKFIFIDVIKTNDTLEISIKNNDGIVSNESTNNIFRHNFSTQNDNYYIETVLYVPKMIIEKYKNTSLNVKSIEFTYENNTYTGTEFKIYLPLKLQKINNNHYIEWDEEKMALGNKYFDDQNKVLLSIINKLSNSIHRNSQKKDILMIVEKLIEYSDVNFYSEEKLFDKLSYEQSVIHKKKHIEFHKKFIDIKKELQKDDVYKNMSAIKISGDIFIYITDWFINHAFDIDKGVISSLEENNSY